MLGSAGKYIGAEEPTIAPEVAEDFPSGNGAGVKGAAAPLAAPPVELLAEAAALPSPQALAPQVVAAARQIATAKAKFAPRAAMFVIFRQEFLKFSSPRAEWVRQCRASRARNPDRKKCGKRPEANGPASGW